MTGVNDSLVNACIAAGAIDHPDWKPDTQTLTAQLAKWAVEPPTTDAGHAALFVALCITAELPAATRWFEQLLSRLPRKLAHMRLADDVLEDVVQRTRVKLLLGNDKPPALLRYAHRGDLGGLALLIATREAISHTRKHKRETSMESWHDLLVTPAADLSKQDATGQVKRAINTVIAGLTSEQRTLLRLTLRTDVPQQQIAAMFQMHPATLRRRLANLRDEIRQGTEKQLGNAHCLSRQEAASLIALVGSRIEASFSRLLIASTTEP